MKFEKWTALGNDYVILEADELPWDLTPERVQLICDPQTGIGSDGILLLSRSEDDGIVADLRIFNPDGSEAELSGNGAREAVMYLRSHGWTDDDEFAIKTAAGVIRPTITGPDTCTLKMGRALTASENYPSGAPDGRGTLSAAGREWAFQHVTIGNPQCAIAVGGELEGLDLAAIGPEIENHEQFPNRTNVSFYRVDMTPPARAPRSAAGGSRVRARIFERGVGETPSSGTGASGAAVAAVLAGAQSPITVEFDGGTLEVEVSGELDVRLSGPAEPLQAGEMTPQLLKVLSGA